MKTIHLHYLTVKPQESTIKVNWNNGIYLIKFASCRKKQTKFTAERIDGDPIDVDFLKWLSVFFGEDGVNPNQNSDTRFNENRGTLKIIEDDLVRFFGKTEKLPRTSYPIWRQELFDLAINYFMAAIRSGQNFMPISAGLFATSIEVLSNVYIGDRKNYKKLGSSPYNTLINARLKRYKKNDKYKDDCRKFNKRLNEEFELIIKLRNYSYGHSLTHKVEEREDLVQQLIKVYELNGASSELAESSFSKRNIRRDIHTNAHVLYKLSLKVSRLLIFYYFRWIKNIPWASKDWVVA